MILPFERGKSYGVVHLKASGVTSLLDFLISSTSEEPERLHELLELGAIYVNGNRTLDSEAMLEPKDYVRAHLQPRRYKIGNLKSRIVSTYENYLVVDKPGGLPTHALVDNKMENLISGLSRELNIELLVTHRLDVETSGLILIAKNFNAQRRLNKMIASHQVRRRYRALVERPLEPGTYVHYMVKSQVAPKTVTAEPFDGSLYCELEILACTTIRPSELSAKFDVMDADVIEGQCEALYELNIELQTGRTQQIRAQLAFLGAPIAGDLRYQSSIQFSDPRSTVSTIALRSHWLNVPGSADVFV